MRVALATDGAGSPSPAPLDTTRLGVARDAARFDRVGARPTDRPPDPDVKADTTRLGFWRNYRPLQIPEPAGEAARQGDWHFCGSALAVTQGWKLYVAAHLLNYLEILATVRPILAAHGIPYKYIASEKALRKLNAGLSGYSQVGKCIVAYLADEPSIEHVLPQLKSALRPFVRQCPVLPFARPIGGGLPLFYRYGAYVGDTIRIGDAVIPDQRSEYDAAVPARMTDAIAAFAEPEPPDPELAAFLLRYPLFEAIAQGGKGAVFAGFDPNRPEFTEVIVKMGYRNGQVMPDGRDGFALLRGEADFFAALEGVGLARAAPARIEYREFRDVNALVMERLPGSNLMALRQQGELVADQVELCLGILAELHVRGLFLGDAKLANFVVDGAGRPRAVDFECAGRIAEAAFDPLRTFRLYNPEIDDLRTLDTAHFLYSVLYDGKAGSDFSERDRLIDLRRVLDGPAPAEPVARLALERLRMLLAGQPLAQTK